MPGANRFKLRHFRFSPAAELILKDADSIFLWLLYCERVPYPSGCITDIRSWKLLRCLVYWVESLQADLLIMLSLGFALMLHSA